MAVVVLIDLAIGKAVLDLIRSARAGRDVSMTFEESLSQVEE